jgi:hypothetical protein
MEQIKITTALSRSQRWVTIIVHFCSHKTSIVDEAIAACDTLPGKHLRHHSVERSSVVYAHTFERRNNIIARKSRRRHFRFW